MLTKLPPQLRLLSHSLPVTRFPSMKPLHPVSVSSRSVPVLSRAFPFRLRYLGLNSRVTHFSTRTGSARTRAASRDGEIRASKSLIEDEEELSDWVGELRTNSFRGLDDDSDIGIGRGKGKGRGRDSDRKGERDSFSMKRRRESAGKSRFGVYGSESDNDYSFGDEERNLSRKRNDGNQVKNAKDRNLDLRFRKERNLDSGFNRNLDSGFRKERNSGSGFRKERESDSGFRKERNLDSGYRKERISDSGLRKERNLDSGFRQQGNLDSGFRKERNLGSGFRQERGGEKGLRKESKDSRIETRLEEETDDGEMERLMGGIGDLLSEEGSGEDDDDDDDDDDVALRNKANSAFGFDEEEKDKARSSPVKSDSYLSESRFDQYPLSPLSLKAIKDAGYEKMTVVQEASLPLILKGKDVLAKAKTGTGKTVAFLLPSIEVAVKSPPVSHDNKRPPILVLVICPTRELAGQAAAEANTLLKYHPSIGVQVVIGGTRLALEQKRMQANPCQILVATPGRLRDHIENTAGFATRLMGVKVLVLDEADHLLDMGFRKDIEKIIAAVPKQRQTLLFSATVPEEVRQICHIALKRDHEFVNTVQEGSGETHSQVRQMHMVASLDKHFSLLYMLLKEHIADNVDYKVIVFCTTAMVTRLVANLLGELNLNVREIHSRKPQSYRTRVSDEFRKSKGLILVTSDVSARGVDYPDVTLVIQVGLPADREQYIHRLGRTGRKGKEGQGVLMLAPWEEFFVSAIKDLPITKASLPVIDPEAKKKVERALSHVEMKNKEAAYQAWLGFYNSQKPIGRDKCRLVELANEFSRSMGLDNPPAIPKLVLGKMGLRNIPGLRAK